jgi:lipoprotein
MTESSNKKKKYMGLSVLALISIGACSMYTFNQSQTKTEVAQETTENTTESVSVTQKETTKTPQTTVAASKEPSNELDKIVELAQAEVGEEVVETSLLNNVVALSENATGSNEVLDKVVEIVTPEKPEDNLAVISVVKPDEASKQTTPEQSETPTTSEKTSEESPASSGTPNTETLTPEQPSLPEEPNVPLPEPEQPTEPELTDQEKALDIKTKEIDGEEVKYATGDALTQEELPEFDVSQLSPTTETN